jgi:hypothetical protein
MTTERLFLTLVVCQALHFLEEVTFGLYRWLPYFQWLESAAPGMAVVAFVAINTAFVAFGAWCYLARVKPRAPSAGVWITLWMVVEIGNGIGHPLWSLIAGAYVPGTATAPLLLVVALLMARQRLTTDNRVHLS